VIRNKHGIHKLTFEEVAMKLCRPNAEEFRYRCRF